MKKKAGIIAFIIVVVCAFAGAPSAFAAWRQAITASTSGTIRIGQPVIISVTRDSDTGQKLVPGGTASTSFKIDLGNSDSSKEYCLVVTCVSFLKSGEVMSYTYDGDTAVWQCSFGGGGYSGITQSSGTVRSGAVPDKAVVAVTFMLSLNVPPEYIGAILTYSVELSEIVPLQEG